MKSILLVLLLIVATSCKSQIYPLNAKMSDLPPNAYVKDLNNELDKYVGLWKGNWNGKTLYIEFKKVKYHYEDDNYPLFVDMILGERKIVNSNGIVEVDRITNFNYQDTEFRGIFDSFSGEKRFMFSPENMCMKQASLYIKNFTNTQNDLTF
ncbi:hypothetical protein OF897_21525 [Chryseobacterium formosus]|uniref:DUF6705 domain-containing protein n=1 Tax=Chryseobacterium formosus TaxID=1537363 RepID=A0ABT3XXV9_9FLAO|nr:DUF6705 family protein [Chryseobacterium formosus]MCX8526498.1 hypothetical protein [Chryseobacterium formosus]